MHGRVKAGVLITYIYIIIYMYMYIHYRKISLTNNIGQLSFCGRGFRDVDEASMI